MQSRILWVLAFGILVVAVLITVFVRRDDGLSNNRDQIGNIPRISTVAQNLEVPWSLALLPDNRIIFTEREGRVKIVDPSSSEEPILIVEIDEVVQTGEGGLLGLVLHPDFTINRYVYLYYTYSSEGSRLNNKVVRFKFENDQLKEETVILDNIPGSSNHNGGRIKFGPDNYLYITTGDSENPSLAQDRNSLAGKILRITDEGNPVSGNPFDNSVYSYGHRNPQGLAWDSQERLWATEHGPQGRDEINLIEAGQNYGWPVITGDEKSVGMVTPVINSGGTTWAPSGLLYLNGSLFWAGLRGRALYQVQLDQLPTQPTVNLSNEIGRIRDVTVGPSTQLYLSTSNRDGRGVPSINDDRIVQVNLDKL